jgi:hypothetical protein
MAEKKSHHAHKLCRLLTKLAIANEIGPEACWMLTVIAHTEDAIWYSGPVTFWNPDLRVICGLRSEGRLARARSRAVDAGWLIYVKGAKERPPKYTTRIPDRYKHLPDMAVGDQATSGEECSPKTEENALRMRKECVENAKRIRDLSCPVPVPVPKKKAPAVADLSFDAVLGRMGADDRAYSSTLDSPRFRDVWALWLQHRKELGGRKLTPSAANGQIKKLAKLGPADAVAMIEHSVTMGWTGLYPPDNQKGGKDETNQRSRKQGGGSYDCRV